MGTPGEHASIQMAPGLCAYAIVGLYEAMISYEPLISLI
jgi:hypothetical protein